MTTRRVALCLVLALLALAPAAQAYDARQTFVQGSLVVSPEVGYGDQVNLENHHHDFSDVNFLQIGVRFGWLPFSPAGPGPLHGSLEIGLQPLYQRYLDPDAFFAGLGATVRYHFLSLGRFAPYVEAAAFAGGTDLNVPEINSNFTFLLWAGAGASFFVTDRTAIYAGYRWTHVSNGNTDQPNRGLEAHTGVVGMSFFFQ